MKNMNIDIMSEIEAYEMDNEGYVMIMGGTPYELFPEAKAFADQLDSIYAEDDRCFA